MPRGSRLIELLYPPVPKRWVVSYADLFGAVQVDDELKLRRFLNVQFLTKPRLAFNHGNMKPSHQKVLDEALRLPIEARAALAGHLLDSLDDSVDEHVESAWSKEIARRLDDLDRGKVKTVPWSVARRQILGRSGGRSKR